MLLFGLVRPTPMAPAEYLKHAEECDHLASMAKHGANRRALEASAQSWRQAADDELRTLALRLCAALWLDRDRTPGEWCDATLIAGRAKMLRADEANAALDYARKQGWVDVDAALNICLTEKGSRSGLAAGWQPPERLPARASSASALISMPGEPRRRRPVESAQAQPGQMLDLWSGSSTPPRCRS